MEPIFVKYPLKVRMVDTFTQHILYNYDHTSPDVHAKPLCCMMCVCFFCF